WSPATCAHVGHYSSATCTEGSNSSPSAMQSGLQRNQPGLLRKWRKWAQFRNSGSQTGLEKVSLSNPVGNFHSFFSEGDTRSPVPMTASGENIATTLIGRS